MLKTLIYLVFVFLIQSNLCSCQLEPNAENLPGIPKKNVIQSEKKVNRTAAYFCEFETLYAPKISWLKNGEPLPDISKYTITEKIEEGSSRYDSSVNPLLALFGTKKTTTLLTIDNMKIEDSGLYTCTITNSPVKPSPSQDFNVKVTEPEIEIIKVKRYDHAVFLCNGIGDDSAKVTWYRNGKLLPEDPRYRFGKKTFEEANNPVQERLFVFIILNAQMSDVDKYSCEYSDANRYHRAEQNLNVEEREPNIQTRNTHDGPSFICEIRAENPADITWTKNGVELPKDKRYEYTNLGEDPKSESSILTDLGIRLRTTYARLAIHDVELEDSGTYTCSDKNPKNHESEKDFVLKVSKPEISILETSVGGVALLACQYSLKFTPRIIWLKDGKPLPNEDRFVTLERKQEIPIPDSIRHSPLYVLLPTAKYTSLLQLYNTQLEDSGQYTCYVSNSPNGKPQTHSVLSVIEEKSDPAASTGVFL